MKIIKNKEKDKSKFNYLVEQAKLIEKEVKRNIEYISTPNYEEVITDSNKYYLLN